MAEADFNDHFSDVAEAYARFRPSYPAELYSHLLDLVESRELCWDCGTGSGQAALALAGSFAATVATDPSARQLAQAPAHPRVDYRCEPAERSTLADASVDLITAAAVIHWLDHPRFYREVRRVARPGCVLAAWTYSMAIHVSPEVDAVIHDFVARVLGPYWAPEARFLRSGLSDLDFPFEELPVPALSIVGRWTLPRLIGKLGTWSAATAYARDRGAPATTEIIDELTRAWAEGADAAGTQEVRLPLHARVGRVLPAK